jgi:hypothetical protein
MLWYSSISVLSVFFRYSHTCIVQYLALMLNSIFILTEN